MRVAALALLCAACTCGQVLEGNVLDAVTGAPVPRAYVRVPVPLSAPAVETHTDLGGHFRVEWVVTDGERPIVEVTSAGYGRYVRRAPVASSPESMNMTIALTPAAVIEGRMDDEDGFPIVGWVKALQFRMSGTSRRLVPVGTAPANELGEYRITGLPAGHYYVQAADIGRLMEWDLRFSAEFYGGTLTPEGALTLDLKAGETRSGINLHLTRREGVKVLANTLAPASWGKPDKLSLDLANDFDFRRQGSLQADGSYLFQHVPPGSYSLSGAALFPALGHTTRVQQQIEVASSDVRTLLEFEVPVAVEVNGLVLVDGEPTGCPYAIGLGNDRMLPRSTRSRPDGSFAITGVPPGHYGVLFGERESSNSPSCRAMAVSAVLSGKEVLQGGVDIGTVSTGPLRIALTAHLGMVEGRMVGASGKALAGQLIFEQVNGGRLFSVLMEAEGKFSRLLLPGAYYVFAALTSDQSQALADPGYRSQHRNDLPMLSVADGQTVSATIAIPNH